MPRKFKKVRHRDFFAKGVWPDILAMTLGLAAGLFLTVLFFEVMRSWDIFDDKPALRGSAVIESAIEDFEIQERPATDGLAGNAAIEVEDPGNVYVGPGQEDVSFITFSLNTDKDSKLRKLILRMEGFARPRDIEKLQLYSDGKFLAEVPFANGKGRFDNLKIPLSALEKNQFEIKGKIGEEAISGDSFRVGFKGDDSIQIVDSELNRFSVEPDLPVWGTIVRVIGYRIVN